MWKIRHVSLAALLVLAAAALLLAPATAAAAQSATATPAPTGAATPAAAAANAFAVINPSAGFPLDPFLLSLQGGGPVAANTLEPTCAGYITAAPSLSFDYKGQPDLLRGFFISNGDPVLVIKTPAGKYLCSDNTNEQLLDPTIDMAKPAPGRYNVWVGSHQAKDLVPGLLVFTSKPAVDLGTFNAGALIKRPSLPAILPARDRVARAIQHMAEAAAAAKVAGTLMASAAPLTSTIAAQGDLPALEMTQGNTPCGGLVTVKPDYVFDLSGQAPALSIYFEGSADATLLVRTPAGAMLCNDDAATGNLNPLVAVDKPDEGKYMVWVGRVSPEQPVPGVLTVAATAGAQPAKLARP